MNREKDELQHTRYRGRPLAFLTEAEHSAATDEAVMERTCVLTRGSARVTLAETCDRSRDNLVLHRSFLAAGPADAHDED